MKLDAGSVIDRLSAMPNTNPIKRLLRAPLHFIPPGLQSAGDPGAASRQALDRRLEHKPLLAGNL